MPTCTYVSKRVSLKREGGVGIVVQNGFHMGNPRGILKGEIREVLYDQRCVSDMRPPP